MVSEAVPCSLRASLYLRLVLPDFPRKEGARSVLLIVRLFFVSSSTFNVRWRQERKNIDTAVFGNRVETNKYVPAESVRPRQYLSSQSVSTLAILPAQCRFECKHPMQTVFLSDVKLPTVRAMSMRCVFAYAHGWTYTTSMVPHWLEMMPRLFGGISSSW